MVNKISKSVWPRTAPFITGQSPQESEGGEETQPRAVYSAGFQKQGAISSNTCSKSEPVIMFPTYTLIQWFLCQVRFILEPGPRSAALSGTCILLTTPSFTKGRPLLEVGNKMKPKLSVIFSFFSLARYSVVTELYSCVIKIKSQKEMVTFTFRLSVTSQF